MYCLAVLPLLVRLWWCCLPLQVPPGGTNFQFRDPTEARHAVWQALTSKDNPKPLPEKHFALAVGSQAYCLGGAGIYSAPSMAGPWTYQGSLYNQLVPEPQVRGFGGAKAWRYMLIAMYVCLTLAVSGLG